MTMILLYGILTLSCLGNSISSAYITCEDCAKNDDDDFINEHGDYYGLDIVDENDDDASTTDFDKRERRKAPINKRDDKFNDDDFSRNYDRDDINYDLDSPSGIDLDDSHYEITNGTNTTDENNNCICTTQEYLKIMPNDSIIFKCSDNRYKRFNNRIRKYEADIHDGDAYIDEDVKISLKEVFTSMMNLRITRTRLNNTIFVRSNDVECGFNYFNDILDPAAASTTTVTNDDQSITSTVASSASVTENENDNSVSTYKPDTETETEFPIVTVTSISTVKRDTTTFIRNDEERINELEYVDSKFEQTYIYTILNVPTNCERNIENLCSKREILCKLAYVNDEDATVFYLTIAATILNCIISTVVTVIIISIVYIKRSYNIIAV